MMPFFGHLIIGMNLNRKKFTGINKFNEQGKLNPKSLINIVAHQIAHVNLNQFLYGIPSKISILHHRKVSINSR